jgi:hypothetical protein
MLIGPTDLTTEKQSIESNDAAEEGDRFFSTRELVASARAKCWSLKVVREMLLRLPGSEA